MQLWMYDARKRTTFNNTGVYGAEVPPVPIPNTEVKLSCAESTWLDTAWEDMSMPVSKTKKHTVCVLFCFSNIRYWYVVCCRVQPINKDSKKENIYIYFFYLGKFSDGIGERAINTKVQYEEEIQINWMREFWMNW